MKFSEVAIGQFFEDDGLTIWQRVPAQGLWNAMCGSRPGQFEDEEEVRPTDYRPPPGWVPSTLDFDVSGGADGARGDHVGGVDTPDLLIG